MTKSINDKLIIGIGIIITISIWIFIGEKALQYIQVASKIYNYGNGEIQWDSVQTNGNRAKALDYCESLNGRLPYEYEIQEIIDECKESSDYKDCIEKKGFKEGYYFLINRIRFHSDEVGHVQTLIDLYNDKAADYRVKYTKANIRCLKDIR